MSTRKPFTLIAAGIFALMAIAHVYRLFVPFEVNIGGCHLPQWASGVAVIIAGGLSWMLYRESNR
jgi:hypothetical protein